MSNGHANCYLGVCCPPRSPQQKAALYEGIMHAYPDADSETAKHCANWIAETFDLAPAGSLVDFKAIIAKLARENP